MATSSQVSEEAGVHIGDTACKPREMSTNALLMLTDSACS